MARVALAITGMHCDHCRHTVTKALESVEGVQSVAVFLAEGEAEVDVAVGTPRDQLAAAVTAAGYPATVKPA